MDDPLMPNGVGKISKWALYVGGAGTVIFILVAVFCMLLDGGGHSGSGGGWIVASLGFLAVMTTTATFARWVTDGSLDESKHTYLLALQFASLLLLSGGLLKVLYTATDPTFIVAGGAGPIWMELPTGPVRGGPLMLSLNDNTSDTITLAVPQGTGASFVFGAVLEENARYAVTIKQQPSGAKCTLYGGSGFVTKNVGVSVACQKGWLIGGQLNWLSSTPYVPNSLILIKDVTPGTETETYPIPIATSGSQIFSFPTPVVDGFQYKVSFPNPVPPAMVNCSLSPFPQYVTASAPVTNIVVSCT